MATQSYQVLEIRDYHMAALLKAAGADFRLRLDDDGQSCVFEFFGGEDASTLLTQHESGGFEINSRDMHDALVLAKNILFAFRRERGLR